MSSANPMEAPSTPAREPELRVEGAPTDAALAAWRRKAADVLLIAAAAVHLPAVVLLMLGQAPPMAPWMRGMFIPIYLVVVSAALLHRIDYRARLWASFVAGYLAVAVTSIAVPRGPYSHVGLVGIPILMFVLLGAPAAKVAITVSTAIFVSAALLRTRPGVVRTLAIDPSRVSSFWLQAVLLAVWLIAVMVLLGSFKQFLLNALAAQYRAKAALEREVIERTATQRKLEHEMRERQRLEREIAAIGDGERRRLGQELHDGVCQQVAAALLRCQALDRRVERGEALSSPDFEALSSLLAESIEEAHNVALGLCPLEPDCEALAQALRALAKRIDAMTTVRCEFIAMGDVRVPDPAMAQHLYRIAQEALSNAEHHAHASRITVELRGIGDQLLLRVEDNGVGLPVVLPAGGMGLRTMAYRAQILDGELKVEPAPGGGACVSCRVPRSAGALAAKQELGGERWMPAA